jgi:peroxiredoxin Q/BCP
MLNVGDTAPEFAVKDHTGKLRSLKDFRGKRVVLWFYPKADTPGCTAEGCGFRERSSRYGEKGAAILGVSFDTQQENAAFAQKFKFDYPLLCDTDRAIGLAYGACDTKDAANAKRIAYVIGKDGKIEQVHAKVKADTFPETLLASL